MDELTSQFPFEIGIDFKYIETLDHGAFGTVIHVIEISTKKDMAIKVINKLNSRPSVIKKVKEEISILKKLNHENIVKFFGFFETNNQLLIKMEYVKYGTLSKWIKSHKKISEEEASIILRQIFSAVVYLHGKQICHRDIKPENIMLSRENDLNSIKIIDFGLSAQNFDKLMNSDYCGTYIYMAPEQIEKKLYFISVDIWSIGILMFMLLNNGKHPFYVKGINKTDFSKKIENCKINFYNKISPMAKHLIFKLLEPNPSWRYNALQAIKHPWITRNKNDEIPLTFNEILHKSNMKKVGRNIFGIILLLNYLTKNKKYIIDVDYEEVCNFYDEKLKTKLIKKKERCLDILSTSEGDDSDSELSKEKILFLKKKEIKNKNINNNLQNSFAVSNKQKNQKSAKKNKLNFAKSSKNIRNYNFILNINKKPNINFKKIENKFNFVPSWKHKTKPIKIKKNNNEFKEHFINISINLNNDKTNKIIRRNINNPLVKPYGSGNISISQRIMNDPKKQLFNDVYGEKYGKKQLPRIITPIRKKETNNIAYSLNDSENLLIVPLVLPNINLSKKEKNFNPYIKKKISIKNAKNRKNS